MDVLNVKKIDLVFNLRDCLPVMQFRRKNALFKNKNKLSCSRYQDRIETDQTLFQDALDEEHYRSEHLEEQINDLSELHQNEVFNIKQVSRHHHQYL